MNPTKMKLWATNKYNVMFEGYHGTGKTSAVKALFNEIFGKQGEDWLYFSSSTMDAWVDFVGVPREVVDEDGTRYLDLIRPRALAKGTVKAIFFDEFNRAPSKTRNAVMELLQFKSINGKRFDNLEVIWAAINPDEDGVYDVERLDPAQRDRFDVHVKVPYDVNKEYFYEQFGRAGEAACDWWRALDEDDKLNITPRRLETTIRMFYDKGDIGDVLPPGISTHSLIVQLDDGSYLSQLNNYLQNGDKENAREALLNQNFYTAVEAEIIDTNKNGFKYIEFFIPLLEAEKLVKLVNKEQRVRSWVVDQEWSDYAHVFDPILAIFASQQDASDDKIMASLVSRLKHWKKNSGGDKILSDAEYIDLMSDFRINISFFKDEANRTEMVQRVHEMLSNNKGLDRTQYVKILGPMLEMFRLKEHEDSVKSYIRAIRSALETKYNEDFAKLLNNNVPGLRTMKNAHAFEKVLADLKTAGLV